MLYAEDDKAIQKEMLEYFSSYFKEVFTANDGKEALLCRLGRNWLMDTFLDKIIIVECSKNDKYGRLLATVYPYEDSSISINQMLMDKKFVRYYGGSLTKLPWSIEELTQGISNAAEIGITDN